MGEECAEMSSEYRALLDAVLDRPDDDFPRLAMADWYEDHGQAERAEFIRSQIEEAAIPVHECDGIYPGCAVDLSGPYVWHDHKCRGYAPQQRYFDLHEKFGASWFHVPSLNCKLDIVRGWPERIQSTLADFLRHAEWIAHNWPVKEVRITGYTGVGSWKGPVADIAVSFCLQYLRDLRELRTRRAVTA